MRADAAVALATGAVLLSTAGASADVGDQLAKLVPEDAWLGDRFGHAVAISGAPGNEVAIVGAYWNDDNGHRTGSAYLFDTKTGEQIAKLLPNDSAEGDQFGISVAISGATAIVGAVATKYWNSVGSAYLFDTTTGEQIAKLIPNDGELGDAFGGSVAISGPPRSQQPAGPVGNTRRNASVYFGNFRKNGPWSEHALSSGRSGPCR